MLISDVIAITVSSTEKSRPKPMITKQIHKKLSVITTKHFEGQECFHKNVVIQTHEAWEQNVQEGRFEKEDKIRGSGTFEPTLPIQISMEPQLSIFP
ncbi:MAG: hypothetical protein WC124_10815 [Desulfoplanes sp.]|nr:hypothetical protein [Desulfoplanes sp.]